MTLVWFFLNNLLSVIGHQSSRWKRESVYDGWKLLIRLMLLFPLCIVFFGDQVRRGQPKAFDRLFIFSRAVPIIVV